MANEAEIQNIVSEISKVKQDILAWIMSFYFVCVFECVFEAKCNYKSFFNLLRAKGKFSKLRGVTFVYESNALSTELRWLILPN